MSGLDRFDYGLFARTLSFLDFQSHANFLTALNSTQRQMVWPQSRLYSRSEVEEHFRQRCLSDCIRSTLTTAELQALDRDHAFVNLYSSASFSVYTRRPNRLLGMLPASRAFYVNLWRQFPPPAFRYSLPDSMSYAIARRPVHRTVVGAFIIPALGAISAMLFQAWDPFFVSAVLSVLWMGFWSAVGCYLRHHCASEVSAIKTDYVMRRLLDLPRARVESLAATYQLTLQDRDGLVAFVSKLYREASAQLGALATLPQASLTVENVTAHLRSMNAIPKSVMIELLRLKAERFQSTASREEWNAFMLHCRSFNANAPDWMRDHVAREIDKLPGRYGRVVTVGVVLSFFAACYFGLTWFAYFFRRDPSAGLLGGYLSSSIVLSLFAWPMVSRWYKSNRSFQHHALYQQYRLVTSAIGGLAPDRHAIVQRFRLGEGPSRVLDAFEHPIKDIREAALCFSRCRRHASEQPLLNP